MGLFDNCILACDVDGTLLSDGYINPKSIEKIKFFMSEGGSFSLSTGRTPLAVKDVIKTIGLVSPSVATNGCIIYDFTHNKPLYQEYLNNSDYKIARLVAESGFDIGIEIDCGCEILTLRRNKETDDHQAYQSLASKVVTFDEACKYSWNKVVYMCSTESDREKIKVLTAKEKVSCDFVDSCVVIDSKTRFYYEQTPKSISKAVTLKRLCEMLSIKKGGIFAIGDYYNDVKMLEFADISAVPIDSPKDVKAYADYITCTCNEGAVADFIDYLIKNTDLIGKD